MRVSLDRQRFLLVGLAGTIATGAPLLSAKEYRIEADSGGRVIVFEAPAGWTQGAVNPTGDEIIFRQPYGPWLPQLSIRVRRINENSSDAKSYVEEFISVVDTIGRLVGEKNLPQPQVTQIDASNGSRTHPAPVWCIRSAAYHDYFITELIDREIQVEITLEAVDAEEAQDKVGALKALASSVQVVDR